MAFDFTPVLRILPQFIIAGIVAIVFYSEFKEPLLHGWGRPRFILVRGGVFSGSAATSSGVDESHTPNSSFYRENRKSFISVLGSAHMVLLTVNLWIIMAIAILPEESITKIFPSITGNADILIYGFLAALFLATVVATVVSRINGTKLNLLILLAIGGVGAYLSFYLPFMQWVGDYQVILRAVMMYCVVAASVFGIYVMSSLVRKEQALRVAVIGSYLSYVYTAAILTINLLQNAL